MGGDIGGDIGVKGDNGGQIFDIDLSVSLM